jgi:hypothetical protein
MEPEQPEKGAGFERFTEIEFARSCTLLRCSGETFLLLNFFTFVLGN